MLSAVLILVIIALILAVLSFIPQASNWNLVAVAVLLLSIALLVEHR
jgi:hypothetical protein